MQAANTLLKLSPRERALWQTHGFFVRTGQFTPAELTRLRTAIQSAVQRAHQATPTGRHYSLDGRRFVDVGHTTLQFEPPPRDNQLRVLEPLHAFSADLDALSDDPRLTQPIQELLEHTQLSLWTAKLNLKHTGGSGFGWHQDSPYWVHACANVEQLPNVMLAIDRQTQHNGCLQIIRGSHRLGMLPGTDDGSQLGGFFTAPQHVDLNLAEGLAVQAGALIFFHPHCIHGSAANHSMRARRALIFTYQPGVRPMLKDGSLRPIRSA